MEAVLNTLAFDKSCIERLESFRFSQIFFTGECSLTKDRAQIEEAMRSAVTLRRSLSELSELFATLLDAEESEQNAVSVQQYWKSLCSMWPALCDTLRNTNNLISALRTLMSHRDFSTLATETELLMHELQVDRTELTELLRALQVGCPSIELKVPDDIYNTVWYVHIPWWAYLLAMWNQFWSAVLHPLSETTIDLSTGRVLYRT